MSPEPGSTLNMSPASIVLTLSSAINPASVNSDTVHLLRSGPDGIFGTDDDALVVPTSLSVINGNQIKVDLTGVSLPAQQYRIVVSGSLGAGNALHFDTGNYALVPNFGTVAPTDEITVEFWQNAYTSFSNPATFGMGPDVGTNRINAAVPWPDGNLYWDFGSKRLTDQIGSIYNTWHHFALVSSKSRNYMRAYRDGVLDASNTTPGTFVRGAYDLYLGNNGVPHHFVGVLDEFRIWNVARSQAQIQASMKGSVNGNEPGLLAYYNLDEGTGQATNDRSPNGYNGTFATNANPDWVVSGAGIIAGISDINGRMLDGEFAGSFPSGDGNAGGDFIAQFALVPPPVLNITSMSPAPNSINLTSLTSITVDFSAPVLASSINPASVLLVRAGPDGIFDTADDVAISLQAFQIQMTTPSRMTIDVSSYSLPPDKYRVSIIGGIKGATSSSNAIVTVPNFGIVAPTDNYTIEFWQYFTGGQFHLPTTFQLNPIVSGNVYQFHSPWNSGPDYIFWDLGGDRNGVTNINTRSVWAHFALVKSGTTIKVYYNGNLVMTSTLTTQFTNYQSDLQLPASNPQPFLGRIDEFRIWNVVRTAAQIKTYMNRTMSGSESGLMAYWDFNEGSGTVANDKTGHGYTGTMATPVAWTPSDMPLIPPVTDQFNNVLDGEFSGNFPSGNGIAGGDFNAQFTLALTVPPFTVTAMTPAPGSLQTSAVNSIQLTFNSAVDSTTVSNNSIVVKSAGPNGILDDGDDVVVSPTLLTVVGGNQLQINLPSQTNTTEKYRLTLNGTTSTVLKAANGVILDGEYSGTLPSGNGTAGGDFTTTFQVNLLATTVAVNAPAAIGYGATTTALSATVNSSQSVNAGNVTFQLMKSGSPAGPAIPSATVSNGFASVNYAIASGTAAGDYTVAAKYNNAASFAGSSDSSQTLTINTAPLSITPADSSIAYGTANPTLTGNIVGIQYSDNITATYSTNATVTSPPNTYDIVPTPVDPGGKLVNYTLTVNNGILTVTKAPLTITVNSVHRPYATANPTFTATYVILKNGDVLDSRFTTSATQSSPVGSYTVTASLNATPAATEDNYAVTFVDGTLTIDKVPLSAAAFNVIRIYGEPNPVFSGILTGVVNGDNILAVYNSAATPATPFGNYAIVPSLIDPDGAAANYTFTASNGTLTIKGALSVAANNVTRPIGAPNPILTGTITGIQNNDNLTATYATTATIDSPLGQYPIITTLRDPDSKLTDYVVTAMNGTLTVVAATPVVISSLLSASGEKGVPFTYVITAVGSAPMTFAAAELPSGLTFNGNTISGIPAVTGVFNISLSVTNYTNTDSKLLKLTVIQPGVNHAPVISSPPTASANPATTGTPVAFTVQASDADGDNLDYNWDFGDGTTALGASVSNTFAVAGVYTVKFTVSDGQASDAQSINLVVNDQPPGGIFTIERASITFNFTKPANDSLMLSGQLPASASPKSVRILIGTLDKTYALNSRGDSEKKAFHLKGKTKGNRVDFSFALKKQDIFATLEDLGFTKTTNNPSVDLPVAIVLDTTAYVTHVTLSYSVNAKKGVPQSGKAKK